MNIIAADPATVVAHARTLPATPLSDPAWLEALASTYRVATRLLAAEDAGRVVGSLALYMSRERPRHLRSLPHGLLAQTPEAEKALLGAALDCAQQLEAPAVTVSTGVARPAAEGARRATTFRLALLEDADVAFDALPRKTRNMLRKASAAGVTASPERGALDAFYAAYAHSLPRQGVAIHPRRFFHALADAFGDRLEVLVARRGGRCLGALVLLHGPVAAYPFLAVGAEGRGVAASAALVWAAARSAAGRSASELEMGESRAGSGVYAFKRNFGGTPTDVHYLDLRRASARRDVRGIAVAMARPLLPRLPTPFGRAVGTWLKSQGRLL